MSDWNDFKGVAKRIDDIDLPRIGHEIRVGEDELHAFIDTESRGKGFDRLGRPIMLFEPHVFWRNLTERDRVKAEKAGLAYRKWKPGNYPRDSYPRLIEAMKINETAALKACSWGLTQVLGENHKMVGFATVQAMVLAMMDDEENHVKVMVAFIIGAGIDDEMRDLAALTRPTKSSDCIGIVAVYNGPGYRKNDYHTKFANAHNKWRGIKDTEWAPGMDEETLKDDTSIIPPPPDHVPASPKPRLSVWKAVKAVLGMILWLVKGAR